MQGQLQLNESQKVGPTDSYPHGVTPKHWHRKRNYKPLFRKAAKRSKVVFETGQKGDAHRIAVHNSNKTDDRESDGLNSIEVDPSGGLELLAHKHANIGKQVHAGLMRRKRVRKSLAVVRPELKQAPLATVVPPAVATSPPVSIVTVVPVAGDARTLAPNVAGTVAAQGDTSSSFVGDAFFVVAIVFFSMIVSGIIVVACVYVYRLRIDREATVERDHRSITRSQSLQHARQSMRSTHSLRSMREARSEGGSLNKEGRSTSEAKSDGQVSRINSAPNLNSTKGIEDIKRDRSPERSGCEELSPSPPAGKQRLSLLTGQAMIVEDLSSKTPAGQEFASEASLEF